MKIDTILSSIQSSHTESREQQSINIDYGCLNNNNSNNNKKNAYIFLAKINSSDHSFLTHKEDIFIWP